jgi:hypothetical protein
MPLKRRLTFKGPHCVISQNIGLFIVADVRTADPINEDLLKQEVLGRINRLLSFH